MQTFKTIGECSVGIIHCRAAIRLSPCFLAKWLFLRPGGAKGPSMCADCSISLSDATPDVRNVVPKQAISQTKRRSLVGLLSCPGKTRPHRSSRPRPTAATAAFRRRSSNKPAQAACLPDPRGTEPGVGNGSGVVVAWSPTTAKSDVLGLRRVVFHLVTSSYPPREMFVLSGRY